MITGTSGNTWYMTTPDGKAIPRTDIPHDYYAAICKLRDYERTGLDPDGVERLKNLLDEMQAIIGG